MKVDKVRLLRGQTNQLGHNFNRKRKEYETEQIGSILSFYTAEEDGETILYGRARIDKSNADLVDAITEMYEDGSLFFSFEIMAAKTRREGKYIYVGADPENRLTAMCIVSIPAYKDARAIRLVASLNEELMQNMNSVTQWAAAELEMDDVHRKLFMVLFDTENPLLPGGWVWDIREIGVDYALLKNRNTGKRMMVKYHVSEDQVIVDEMYEVEIVRKATEAVEPMAAEPDNEDETKVDDEEEDGDEKSEEDAPVDAAGTAEPVAVSKENHAESVAAEEDPVQRELAELRRFKAQVEQERIEAELNQKRAKLKATVVSVGLDPESLSAEIEALNYEAIFASIAEAKKADSAADEPIVNMMAGADMSLAKSKWDGLISDATGLN